MKSWSLIAALAAGCFGFAAAFTAAPSQAAGRCPFCQERLDICLEHATTPEREAACQASFDRCLVSACP
ncbi:MULTISPECIES: hypothetical protein [Lysobacter]|jgi:hypothetical protein|uniref:hypothetical protein n=1 Tax=Lysobacter TaxID=68 RepID=UPI001F2FB0A5|nr:MULTISPECIES: hypothetical protein [Lysobacter]UJB20744.1 hypothetical protein L1A79_06625 [Lysobacter capsici]UJQ30142.1 hypothetical protein L2D09_08235 [Lysobacter gummosus]